MTTLLDLIGMDMPARPTPLERFEAFHELNPQVYDELESMTARLVDHGRRHIGMKMLFEVMRWNYYLRAGKDEEFKLNNNYASWYSRLLLERHPEWTGVFELREQHAPSRLVPK